MPFFTEYREPLVGGGSVFVKTMQTTRRPSVCWINDLYYDLYCFWKETKNNVDAVIETIEKIRAEYPDGNELHKFLCAQINEFEDVGRAAAFFILNRITFSGTSCSGGYSKDAFRARFTASSIEKIKAVSQLLTDVKITNEDYSAVLSEAGKNVFIFMDPPYYTATKSALYGKNGELNKGFDHERFAECVKRCNHKWMITYDDCDYIKNLYKDYNIKPFEITYGMRNVRKEAQMNENEIMIMNY